VRVVGPVNKQARREQDLRHTLSAPVGKPETRRRALIEIEPPTWLPQPIAAHARQINCLTASDELTSDLRMKDVWTELRKRKRFNYKSSEAFRYPTLHMDWSPEVKAKRRRVQTLRRMSGPVNEEEAKKLEAYAALNRFEDLVTWGQELPVQWSAPLTVDILQVWN
jgi:hypothetical protein